MQTGNRWDGNVNPRDLTRVRQQKLLADKAAREKAANEVIDIAEVKRQSFEAGREQGYAKGLEDGWDAGMAALVAAGILAPDEDQADEQEAV